MFSCKICKFFKSTYIEEHLLLFFLLPLQILLTVIADWNRRSTNCKAILGLLTDLIFMPISASWNVNQMYYEFPPLKFGKISRNNGHNVTIVEIVNRKIQEFQSSCCICCYIWHHMLHFYICLSGNSPANVVKKWQWGIKKYWHHSLNEKWNNFQDIYSYFRLKKLRMKDNAFLPIF